MAVASRQVSLPPPFGKQTDAERPVTGDIRFPGDGEIASVGRSDDFAWDLLFVNDEGMAFERGTLVVGDDVQPVHGGHAGAFSVRKTQTTADGLLDKDTGIGSP